MDELTGTTGIAALIAGTLALAALIALAILWRRLRRLRADQRVVLGEKGRDLVAHAADLERHFEALQQYVIDVASRLEQRLDHADERLDGAIAHRAVVRYDAYNEMSGRQSMSIALLDARRCGVVLSSIQHRDQARLYVKQVVDGRGSIELSPEEADAVGAALTGEVPDQRDPGGG